MKQKVYHNEIVKISQSARNWIISLILLFETIMFTLFWYFYKIGAIPNKDFENNDMIGVIIVSIIFSIIIILVIVFQKYVLIIGNKNIILKRNLNKRKIIFRDEIISYKKLSRKEARELLLENRKKKKQFFKSFYINLPNYLLILQSRDNILLETKRKDSFEYAMNKFLKSDV